MQNTASFKLYLFGGFHLTDVDGNQIDPGPRKVKALLGWLAVNPDVEHPREKIAAMFWPDSEENVARHSLRQALASLRKVMPGDTSPLRSFKSSILFDSSKIDVDALDFEAALAKGEVRASEEITYLYKGEFLAGCNPRADLFEDWLNEHRHYYRERAVNAICQWLTVLIDTRKFERAVPIGVKLLTIDPLRESAYRGLMMAHMALGNHALALRWYRRCERVLLSELDVLPCLETRALHAQLLSSWDTQEPELKPGVSEIERKRKSLGLISKGNQRILYLAEGAIEGIIDHIGGQSILLRGESADAKKALAEQVIALAKLQGFQVCRGTISTDGEPFKQLEGATSCTHISSCLVGNAIVGNSNMQELEHKLEECIDSIKTASEVSPVLLVLENIHAAGQRMLNLLSRLIAAVGEASVLLLMTSSYDGESHEKAWQGAMVNSPLTTLDLP